MFFSRKKILLISLLRSKYVSNYPPLNPLIIDNCNKNIKSQQNEVKREEKLPNLLNIMVRESHENSCRGIQMLNEKIRVLKVLSWNEKQRLRHKKTLPELKLKQNEREIIPADINSFKVVSRAETGGVDTKIDRDEILFEKQKDSDDMTEEVVLQKKNSGILRLKDELTTYFESLTKSYQSLMAKINAYGQELKKRDDKLIELLDQSRPIFFDGLGMSSLIDQIKMVESQLYDTNIARDKLLNELYRILEHKLINEKLLKDTHEKFKNEINENNEISERVLDINPIFDFKNKDNNWEKDESSIELNLETFENDENLNTLLDQRRKNVEEMQQLEEYFRTSSEYKNLQQEKIQWNEKLNHVREELLKNREDLEQFHNRLVQEGNEMKALTTNISDDKEQLELCELKLTKLETSNKEIHNKFINVTEAIQNYKKQLSVEFESTKFIHKELSDMKRELINLFDKLNTTQKNYNDLKIKQDNLNKQLIDVQEVRELRTTNDNVRKKSSHISPAASSTPITLKLKDEILKNKIISLEESIDFCKFGISQLNRKIETLDALFESTEKFRLYKDEFEYLQNELLTSQNNEHSFNQLDKQFGNKDLDEKMDLTKINSLVEENQLIKNKLKKYESMNKKLSKNLNKAEEGHSALSETIHTLLNNVVASKSFIGQLENGYNQVKETFSTAKEDIESSRRKVERIKHDAMALKNHNESLKAEILVFNKQLNENYNHTKSTSKMFELLKMKLHDKQTQSDDLESNFHDYKSKIKSLMTEVHILKKEIENFKKYRDIKEVKLNDAKIAKEGLFIVNNELIEFKIKWNELTSDIDYLKKQIEDSKTCNVILNNLLDRVKSIINNLRAKNDDLNLRTKQLDARFETIQINNEEQKKFDYELANRSLDVNEEYNEPKKEVTHSPADLPKERKDSSRKSFPQDELEIFKNNTVNLEKNIETNMVENNHLYEELKNTQNDMSTLKLKSNETLMVHSELIDKVKTINHENASLNEKVDRLRHYNNVEIESRSKDKLLKYDSLRSESQISELKGKDINDLTDNGIIDSTFTNVNKLLKEVELDDNDTFHVADQSSNNVEAHQETLEKLQKRNIVFQNTLETKERDFKMSKNENRNLDKTSHKTNRSIKRMKNKDNDNFINTASGKIDGKRQLQRNIAQKVNIQVLNSGQRQVKAERQKVSRKQNNESLTTLKDFEDESSNKDYRVDDEDLFYEFHNFIYKKMKKHLEGLSCINDTILDMKNQQLQRDANIMVLNSDNLTVFGFSNPFFNKIAQLSVNILNNIKYIISNLTEVNEMLKNYLKENLQLKITFLKDSHLGIPISLSDDILESEEWLEFITLTQLADMHEKICLMALRLVTEDDDLTSYKLNKIFSSSKCLNKCDRGCKIMSPRITAIQRQISEVQKRMFDKVAGIQKATEHRKTGLDEISKTIENERQRNYTSYPVDNESSPASNICVGKCAEEEKFIKIIKWKQQ